jgi:hypothetical protein
MESAAHFSQSLGEILATSDGNRLERLVNDIAQFCFQEHVDPGPVHAECLNLALEALTDVRLHRLPGGYHLLLLFQYDWGALSISQQQRLLTVISSNYDKYADWMGCHVMAELLGRFFCNQESLDLLAGLSKTGNEVARSFVPLGLESLSRETLDPNLRTAAINLLSKLANDSSQLVRDEAVVSFNRLSRACVNRCQSGNDFRN